MRVSLIICSYNRMHTLPRTLEAVSFLRYPELEVIVVDGPSNDGTEAYLRREWGDRVRLLKCPVANLSVSRNIGIAAAAGEVIAFTDDDGLPEPDWLERIVPCFDDPRVGAVGGFVRDHTGVDFQTRFISSDRHGFSHEQIASAQALSPSVPGGFTFPRLIGVNSTFRHSVLLEIGGFDEHYAYFYDEVDVALRLTDAGYRVVICPEAEVHHKYAMSHIRTEKGVPKSWFQIGRSTSYFCLRNAPWGQSLDRSLDVVQTHKENFVASTHWAAASAGLSDADVGALLQTLDSGIDQGIEDAFAQPARQLLSAVDEERRWLTLPRTLAAPQRQRFAFVTDLYPPRECGGVAVFMRELALELARQGHEVSVITFGEAGRAHTVDFEEGVWVHRIQPDAANGLEARVAQMPVGMNLAAQSVLDELDRVDQHRQFTWVLGTLWDLHTAAAIASGRYRVVLYLVTSYKLMLDSKPEWKPGSHFYTHHVAPMVACERWALQQADKIISSTAGVKRDCERAYGVDLGRAAVLPFGLRDVAPGERTAPAEGLRLLFVGRFERRKGIDLLLQILPALLTRYPQLRVDLVGDNTIPFEDGIPLWEAFCASHRGCEWFNRVDAPGVVSGEALLRFYAECDIFVAPSRYESFGLIYLEAMRAAKPCVGFAVGGVPEVVVDGETGILPEEVSAAALKATLVRLLDDAGLRERMGRAGRSRFESRFTVERFADEFVRRLC